MHHNSKDRLIFEPLANSSWILRSLAIALLLSSASISIAQRITASLGGIVRDSSAAVIPNARVSIANTGTQVTTKTQTNGEGRFEVSNLPPGPYSVAVDASGFKRLVRSGLVLNVDQTAQLEIVLEVGSATDTVQVNSVEPLLETQSSDIGQVIGNRSIENLPLNQRNPFSLVLLAPGVTGSVNASFTGLQFNVNGARAGNTDVLLDGVPATQRSRPVIFHHSSGMLQAESSTLFTNRGRTICMGASTITSAIRTWMQTTSLPTSMDSNCLASSGISSVSALADRCTFRSCTTVVIKRFSLLTMKVSGRTQRLPLRQQCRRWPSDRETFPQSQPVPAHRL